MSVVVPKTRPSRDPVHVRERSRSLRVMTLCAVVLAMTVTSGCSSLSGMFGGGEKAGGATATPAAAGDRVDDSQPVAELYNQGLDYLQQGRYERAARQFEEVERQHPYSNWATRATLMAAFAHYQRNNYDSAINTAQRFVALHPGHRDAAYAYYLIALSHYEQIVDVKRDQSTTEKALAALEEVSRRFPDSAYAKDAEAKAVLARDHLAGKEMEIGRWYLNQKAYVGAINRFREVVTKYQTTSHTPEALYRLVEAYLALGIVSEAQTAAAVLGHNFGGSEWYRDAYALLEQGNMTPQMHTGNWLSRLFS